MTTKKEGTFKQPTGAFSLIAGGGKSDKKVNVEEARDNITISDSKPPKYTHTNTDKHTHIYTDSLPKRETKSKRLNLLIYPSLYKDIERLAEMQAIKSNELICRILKEYTGREESQLMIENHKKITKRK